MTLPLFVALACGAPALACPAPIGLSGSGRLHPLSCCEASMAKETYNRALTLVLAHEGGYVDDPRDPGGATNLGVTIGTLSRWFGRPASKGEVRALTAATVAPIYRKKYWRAVRGDDLPAGVDYAVFDFAVNSGPARAIMALQRAAGVADDGHLGAVTLAALARQHPSRLVELVCADRLAFLRRLRTWPVFGRGWQRRVAAVCATATKMATPAPVGKAGPSARSVSA